MRRRAKPRVGRTPEPPRDSRDDSAASDPELFFGLVGAVGTDLAKLAQAIEMSLKTVNYSCSVVRLSSLLRTFNRWTDLHTSPEDTRIRDHMNAGSEFRELMQRGDALAVYGIGAIREERARRTRKSSQPIARHAYIFHSLKNPGEVSSLRRIYGRNFLLVGAYSPREARLRNLARRIAASHDSMRFEDYIEAARELNSIDEEESERALGQNVRDTFPLADVFIDTSDDEGLTQSVGRFVELVFGYPFHTPTRDEYGMFHAKAAAMRSATLSRQVGAAIATERGEILALGTNEVPKALGGLYWPGDPSDKRDFHLGYDISDKMKRNTLAEILERLAGAGWLNPNKNELEAEERVNAALRLMKGSQLMRSIEFSRAVHAEVSAMLDAALRGVAVRGSTLYTTTFPCHDCARHIVAAGISRVRYIEPYPKSFAMEFHEDSIAVDQGVDPETSVSFRPFVGIAPARYMDFFDISGVRRKGEDGTITDWGRMRQSSTPKLIDLPPTYLIQEQAQLSEIVNRCNKKRLM